MLRPLLILLASIVCASAEPLTLAEVSAVRARILSNFFATELPPLDAKVHRRFEPAPGVAAEAVTYATQFGTRALGREFPGFQREDLCALSAAEWEARRNEFILEAWDKAARTASGANKSP